MTRSFARRSVLGLLALGAPALAGCSLRDLGLGRDRPGDPPRLDDPEGNEPEPRGEGDVEPYVVKGRVIYADGRPLAGAEIGADNTLAYDSNLITSTDADGRYRLEIPRDAVTTWKIWGYVTLDYEGETYRLGLDHVSDAFASNEGAVRDLSLRLSGPMTEFGNDPDHYHGVDLEFHQSLDDEEFFDGSQRLDATLTPVGPLVDGSTGEALTRTIDGWRLGDVPIGRYEIAVTYAPEGGEPRQLPVSVSWEGPFEPTVTAVPPAEGVLTVFYSTRA